MIPILAKYSKGDVYFVIIRRAPFKMFVEKKYLTTFHAYLCKLDSCLAYKTRKGKTGVNVSKANRSRVFNLCFYMHVSVCRF